MKNLILILILIFVFASLTTAGASPFLVCDCQDNVEQYVLIFDGGSPVIDDAVTSECVDGQKRLSFDLAPLALSDGQHNIKAAAKNLWGESASVPFDFNKADPSMGSGIGLSAAP